MHINAEASRKQNGGINALLVCTTIDKTASKMTGPQKKSRGLPKIKDHKGIAMPYLKDDFLNEFIPLAPL